MPPPPPVDTATFPEPGLEPGEAPPPAPAPPRLRDVVRTWWPLAASWMLMGAELPAVGAAIARLPDAEVHLAAWGGTVFPLALLFEAPIIMMLAASTALSQDSASYRKILRFTTWSGVLLSAAHGLVAFTPLYDLLVVRIMKPQPEVVEPARLGLQILTLWTWAIADRRFHQGVLIRFGYSRAVSVGTAIRLFTSGGVLAVGLWTEALPGIAVGAGAVTAGVLVEMAYARFAVAPVLRGPLASAPAVEPLTTRALLSFYIPLALTPLFILLMQPIGGAAMNRMPDALQCLAVWPVLNGLVFVLRSSGLAYNEVVVRHLDDPGARPVLVRFAWILAAATSGLMVLISFTPLSETWFADVSGLEPDLTRMAVQVVGIAVLLPALGVAQSLLQGVLTHARSTRAIPEACALFAGTSTAALWVGIELQRWNGLQVALVAFTLGSVVQTGWLWLRSRSLRGVGAA